VENVKNKVQEKCPLIDRQIYDPTAGSTSEKKSPALSNMETRMERIGSKSGK